MNAVSHWFSSRRLGHTVGPIGVEFALEELHLVQIRYTASGQRVHACRSIAYPASESDPRDALLQDHRRCTTFVRNAIRKGGFNGREVVAALPPNLCRVMPLSYQVRQGADDAAAISALLLERLGDEIGEVVVDYMPVQTLASSQAGGERLALVAVSREDSVVRFLETLRGSGLQVSRLEIGPIAIRRLVAAIQRNLPPQNTLVLNCGRRRSYLTVMADERLLADDEVDFGEQRICADVAERLDLEPALAARLLANTPLDGSATDDPGQRESAGVLLEIIRPHMENLAREVKRGLMYANSESRGSRRSRMYLLGGMARWPGFAVALERLLELPVSLMPRPTAVYGSGEEHGPELAVAMGLALDEALARA